MFSELVDDVLARTGRTEKRQEIIDHVNSTIRECDTIARFTRDLVEDTLVVNATPFTWTKDRFFRAMSAVSYDSLKQQTNDTSGLVPNRQPGRMQRDQNYFWYSATDYIVFSGTSGIGDNVNVAYYRYLPKLSYYAVGARPAVYTESPDPSIAVTWAYDPAYITVAQQLTAQLLVSNWLLLRHQELIKEGTCAKAYKGIDDKRAALSFALYKSFQNDLQKNESNEAEPR